MSNYSRASKSINDEHELYQSHKKHLAQHDTKQRDNKKASRKPLPCVREQCTPIADRQSWALHHRCLTNVARTFNGEAELQHEATNRQWPHNESQHHSTKDNHEGKKQLSSTHKSRQRARLCTRNAAANGQKLQRSSIH